MRSTREVLNSHLELRKAGEIELQQAAPFASIRIARPDVEEGGLAWNVRSA